MKNLYKLLICLVILVASKEDINGQFIDNVGLRMGVGFSNQYWEFKDVHVSDQSGWKESKPGLAVYLNAEKTLSPILMLRPEIGYNQKGFKDNAIIIDNQGQVVDVNDNKVVLHNFSFNISLKAKPFEKPVHPYFILGLRGDYMLSYKDIEYDQSGTTIGVYKTYLDNYNKFILSAIFGTGISFRDKMFIDVEYNPALTKNLKSNNAEIHEKLFLITLGFNLNKLYLL